MRVKKQEKTGLNGKRTSVPKLSRENENKNLNKLLASVRDDQQTSCTLLEALAPPTVLFPRTRVSQSPPNTRDEISSSQPYYTKPIEWDPNNKKWMAAD